MVPPTSHKVPRVSWYSGSWRANSAFTYGAVTLSGRLSQNRSANLIWSLIQSEPRNACTPVWPLSISLAATLKIDVSFSSSGYLDVSVHQVPFHTLCIHVWMTGYPAGFPHSDIRGSQPICGSPWLFAAYHVFHRLLVPRHPPCALFCLIGSTSFGLACPTFWCRHSIKNNFCLLLVYNYFFLLKIRYANFNKKVLFRMSWYLRFFKIFLSFTLYEVFKVRIWLVLQVIRSFSFLKDRIACNFLK